MEGSTAKSAAAVADISMAVKHIYLKNLVAVIRLGRLARLGFLVRLELLDLVCVVFPAPADLLDRQDLPALGSLDLQAPPALQDRLVLLARRSE